MALKGNLRDFSTAQLLNLISLAQKTGTLTIEGSETAQMSFRDGKLIYATLGENSNSLSHVLQDAGILTEEQGRIIQTKAKGTSDKQLGHLLIQAGYVTQSDIILSVRSYILDVVYKMFTWVEGLFRFDANQVPPPDRITVPIELDSVIMEGSRRIKELEKLQEELPNLNVTLRFANQPSARLQNINLTVEEWRVVSFVNPQNTVRQIAAAVNLNEFQIRRIVFGLLQAGLIELVEPGKLVGDHRQKSAGDEVDEAVEDKEPVVKRSVIKRIIARIRRL